MDFLSGKKTYIVALLLVLNGFSAFFTGDASLGDAVSSIDWRGVLEGFGLASLRLGVAKA